jgi:hypothetical protein
MKKKSKDKRQKANDSAIFSQSKIRTNHQTQKTKRKQTRTSKSLQKQTLADLKQNRVILRITFPPTDVQAEQRTASTTTSTQRSTHSIIFASAACSQVDSPAAGVAWASQDRYWFALLAALVWYKLWAIAATAAPKAGWPVTTPLSDSPNLATGQESQMEFLAHHYPGAPRFFCE